MTDDVFGRANADLADKAAKAAAALSGEERAHRLVNGYLDEDGKTVQVWCPQCRLWHVHGYDPAMETGMSHRAAHCRNKDSLYRAEGGYLIQLVASRELAGPVSADRFKGGPDIPGLLSDTYAAYLKWFGKDYDLGALNAVLAAAAAERLYGDPPWLLVVGGSGAAKTETLMPLEGAGAVVISTITGEAALLSGTPEKEKAKKATGGLLREIGSNGLLVIKDVTSILTMNRDTRAAVLAALREIYDGKWSRRIGAEGGRSLDWTGRLVVIGAVTTAWDAAYQVISTMGDRFVLVRLRSENHRRAAGRQAMANVSCETSMREELKDIVGLLLGGVDPARDWDLTDAETDELLDLADLVTRARTSVETSYQGDPVFAHALEMPTRYAKQLVQIVRGALAIGLDRGGAMEVALRCCRDTMPPLRLAVLGYIATHPHSTTADAVEDLQQPRTTIDRVLQQLHLLGLLIVESLPYGEKKRWYYSLAPDISAADVQKLSGNVSPPIETP
jgi:hypothetical protein